MNMKSRILNLCEYTQKELISKIENTTNVNTFDCILLVCINDTTEKLLFGKATRLSPYFWDFKCSRNGIIKKIYVNANIFALT